MQLKTQFGIMALISVLITFACYGGLIVLAIWAIGKYIIPLLAA